MIREAVNRMTSERQAPDSEESYFADLSVEKLFDLQGRRIVITGGAMGMGAGLVRAFPLLGATVASLDIAEKEGAEVAHAAGATFVRCDISRKSDVDSAFAKAAAELGGIDVLFNVAGIASRDAAVDTPLSEWEQVMAVNATGTFLTNLAAFGYLRPEGGRIINFASSVGATGMANRGAYAASKGAVLAWSRTIAKEWAPYGITVNCVAPAMWTPMHEHTRSRMSAEELATFEAWQKEFIPLGGRPGVVARDLVPVMAFVASRASRFMTGQVFAVDGGSLMLR
jgi:NAD(P)-dependent dehydrogenase (short-subunit alcohol dehydrogenase family)